MCPSASVCKRVYMYVCMLCTGYYFGWLLVIVSALTHTERSDWETPLPTWLLLQALMYACRVHCNMISILRKKITRKMFLVGKVFDVCSLMSFLWGCVFSWVVEPQIYISSQYVLTVVSVLLWVQMFVGVLSAGCFTQLFLCNTYPYNSMHDLLVSRMSSRTLHGRAVVVPPSSSINASSTPRQIPRPVLTVPYSLDLRDVGRVVCYAKPGTGSGAYSPSTNVMTTTRFPETTMCSICLFDYAEGEDLLHLSVCHHHFHRECVERWLRATPVCPLCRKLALLPSSSSVDASSSVALSPAVQTPSEVTPLLRDNLLSSAHAV